MDVQELSWALPLLCWLVHVPKKRDEAKGAVDM